MSAEITENLAPTEPAPLRVTDAARSTILEMRSAEPEGDTLALRVDVVGVSGPEFAYELTFAPLEEAGPDDAVDRSGDLPVVVPGPSVDKLRGATLDHVDPTGLVLRNPNRPRPEPAATGPVELHGSVEERIRQLLDGQINPMLATHGGFATLDRVEADTAYMTMGGGCQGCGLAALTLTEGIKATVEDAIPEIANVVDVTDHGAGENPFYTPSQK